MRWTLLLLVLASCYDVKRIEVVGPPTTAMIQRVYAVEWGGVGLLTVAAIDAEAVRLEGYPCLLPGVVESIGGSYVYDERSGHFSSDMKSLDGTARVALDGTFRGDAMTGTYAVSVIGLPCASGAVSLTATE